MSGINSVDIIDNCLANKEERTVTVGLLENDVPQYIVFGGGGTIIAPQEYEYELCAVTNILTAALAHNQITKGELSLLSPCSAFLGEMPAGYNFTIGQLITHTSGLSQNIVTTAKRIYSMLHPMHNPTKGINIGNIKEHIQSYKINTAQGYLYCNANYALLGEMLAKSCEQEYAELVLGFLRQELRIMNMKISCGKGDLQSAYWKRGARDSFIAADGLVANVSDVLKLLKKVLEKNLFLYPCTQIACDVSTPYGYAIGTGWLLSNDGIAWQGGSNAGFNSFVGVDFKYNRAVTMLSNCVATPHQSAVEAGLRYIHEKRENSEYVFV